MEKYLQMKNPPRFSGEWKKYAFYVIDAIAMFILVYFAKILNMVCHIPLFFAFSNYILWIAIGFFILWRPHNHPGKRQIFIIIEAIFNSDKDHYHVLDPNRNYHGKAIE